MKPSLFDKLRVQGLDGVLLAMGLAEPEDVAIRGLGFVQTTPDSGRVCLDEEAVQGTQGRTNGPLVLMKMGVCHRTLKGIEVWELNKVFGDFLHERGLVLYLLMLALFCCPYDEARGAVSASILWQSSQDSRPGCGGRYILS